MTTYFWKALLTSCALSEEIIALHSAIRDLNNYELVANHTLFFSASIHQDIELGNSLSCLFHNVQNRGTFDSFLLSPHYLDTC